MAEALIIQIDAERLMDDGLIVADEYERCFRHVSPSFHIVL